MTHTHTHSESAAVRGPYQSGLYGLESDADRATKSRRMIRLRRRNRLQTTAVKLHGASQADNELPYGATAPKLPMQHLEKRAPDTGKNAPAGRPISGTQ